MASSVETTFNAIVAAYLPAGSGVKFYFGAAELHTNDDRPRVVCVVPSAVFEPLNQAGPSKSLAGEKRALYRRRVTMVWHVWMPDDETCEAVAMNIVTAMKRVLGSSTAVVRPVGETFLREALEDQSSGGAYEELTTEVVYELDDAVIAHPVVVPTDQTHTGVWLPGGETVC